LVKHLLHYNFKLEKTYNLLSKCSVYEDLNSFEIESIYILLNNYDRYYYIL